MVLTPLPTKPLALASGPGCAGGPGGEAEGAAVGDAEGDGGCSADGLAPASLAVRPSGGGLGSGIECAEWVGSADPSVVTIIQFFFAIVFHIFATKLNKCRYSPDPLSFSPPPTFCFPTEQALFGILNLTNRAEMQFRNHALDQFLTDWTQTFPGEC